MTRNSQARLITNEIKKLIASEPNGNFNEMRLVVAMERAVARLSAHLFLSKHLVFKGGFVLLKTTNTNRFTRDVDALAYEISKDDVPVLVQEALAMDLVDGFWFGDFQIEEIPDQGEYGGLRFNCAFQLGDPPLDSVKIKKLSRLHIDIGIGDKLYSDPIKLKMNAIIPTKEFVSWLVYPLESIFAEKLQTLFHRGSANSRAKDVYDLIFIFPKCQDPDRLRGAIQLTFKNRNTSVPRSFLEEVKELNLTLFNIAWPSVQLSTPPQPFSKVWKEFLHVCAALDQL